jgi:alanine dehydrogenase
VTGDRPPLYLTDADVAALAPPPGALADIVGAAFRARAEGEAVAPPKAALRLAATGLYCQSMPAAVAGLGAGVKWVALPRESAARGLPHITGLVILCNPDTGRVQAVMEAGHLTALRTAAISLTAARHLTRPESAVLALVGCGVQARAHLDAMVGAFPIARVRLLARRQTSAAAFARSAGRDGLCFEICEDAGAVLAGADLVVSTVPAGPALVPFLDAAALSPGATALMVDLGRSWIPERLDAFDRAFTDDAAQTAALAPDNPGLAALRFAGDLADLEARRLPVRNRAGERVAFAFAGSGIADIAAAAAVLRAARERGAGLVLPS